MSKNSLADLAIPGAEFAIRVTPNARRTYLEMQGSTIKACVSAPPANGAANQRVVRLLAQALRVPKSRLTLVKGHKSRDKVFRLE